MQVPVKYLEVIVPLIIHMKPQSGRTISPDSPNRVLVFYAMVFHHTTWMKAKYALDYRLYYISTITTLNS